MEKLPPDKSRRKTMSDISSTPETLAAKRPDMSSPPGPGSRGPRRTWLLGGAALVLAGGLGLAVLSRPGTSRAAMALPPPPPVTVSAPLARTLSPRTGFLGQFSAVDAVELRAQVGGTLTEIHFTDGQIVHKGDLLFVIDPRPYEIRLAQAVAQVQSAQARLALAGSQFWRAQQLKHSDFGTAQDVDQRDADQRAAQATLDQAKATVRDAELDLEYCHVAAPFTGRISNHRVSIGSLVSGSRAGSAPTTLLTTLVSLDPIHLDFDMSEAEYLAFSRAHPGQQGPAGSPVDISLGDDNRYTTHGALDFIDNQVDRGSGTIRVRATVPNAQLTIAPGEFARLRLTMGPAASVLLVPDSSVMLDQSQQMVMTVAADGSVVPRPVQTGALRDGLRIVQSGLKPTDRVIIDGLMRAQPGMKVTPQPGAIHLSDDDQG